MALKDWKKSSSQNNKWIRKNDTIEIIENYDKNGKLKYHTIEIYLFEDKNNDSRWLTSRRFRKKSMALKSARAYMRKH